MKWNMVFGVFLSCIAGCHDSAPFDVPLAPEFATPVATGIYITSAQGPEIIGVWGNPSDHAPLSNSGISLPREYSFPPVYPNPSDGSTIIGFGLPVASTVAVWIVPAKAPGDPVDDFRTAWGALLPAPQRTAIAYPIPLSTRVAGFYHLLWSGRDGAGNPLPAGFYRVYVRFGEEIYWRDMFLYHSDGDIPSGMRPVH